MMVNWYLYFHTYSILEDDELWPTYFVKLQEKLNILSHKSVAYLNLDVVVLGSGPIIAKASSTLFSTLFQAATKVGRSYLILKRSWWTDVLIIYASLQ